MRDSPRSKDRRRHRLARRTLPSRPGPVQIAVVVLCRFAEIERKNTADIARERLHNREAFWGARRKVLRIPLPLRPSDRTDAGLKRPCFRPDRIVLGRFWLFVRHA
ncbi:hypothetical protein PUN4_180144 [Paraburkholderia unamae]|nr:hypothetical protein PUN4_180144 [Paraburkholderia unamae]